MEAVTNTRGWHKWPTARLERAMIIGADLEWGKFLSKEVASRSLADQEFLALRLLEREEVCQRISQELELLVVDEFQDTSPIQLAILLKLAEVCGKAVWVGDQKQSIFGFRDTDPALMDACMDQLGKEAATETLPKSWRSRPGLVELTSHVFARAFAGHGMPEELVRLAPAIEDEPHGLGPFLERW